MKRMMAMVGGLAAALVASSAQAGHLDIVYWGSGHLEWVTIDGHNYTVDDDTVGVNNVPEGSYAMEFGADGQTRTLTLQLDSSRYSKTGDWCISLDLDEHEYLSADDCEEMWDYYWGF